MALTHLSLFSGIGGLDLAAEWAGIETVCQCEYAKYPRAILQKHWPDIPKLKDIRDLTKEQFYEKTGRRTIDIISGGFPCQPFSVAGERRCEADDRYLWPEILRVIKELKPHWVIGENVAGFISMGLDTALSDLENEGYTTRAFVLPACAVGAMHRRDRVAIIAHANCERLHRWLLAEKLEKADEQLKRVYLYLLRGADENYLSKSAILRKSNGVPNRVDRVRALGNVVVPQQFYPIFKAIVDIEEGKRE